MGHWMQRTIHKAVSETLCNTSSQTVGHTSRLVEITTAAALIVGATQPALADPADQKSTGYRTHIQAIVEQIAKRPDFRALFNAQNAAHQDLTEAEILALDKRWRDDDTALITPVVENPLADVLRQMMAKTKGQISEIIVMDQRGLNVAVSSKTTDYWQGDEDKFQKTFAAGPSSFFEDRAAFDESTGTFSQQISETITIGGQSIGAITIGIDIAWVPGRA